jgi:hypothetical protein
METLHPEGRESPFVVKDNASIAAVMSLYDEDFQYASCPVGGCGEEILFSELESHMEMHGAEDGTDEESENTVKKGQEGEKAPVTFDTKLAYALRNLGESDPSSETAARDLQADTKAAWKGLLKMPETPAKFKGSAVASETTKSSRRRLGVSFSSLTGFS